MSRSVFLVGSAPFEPEEALERFGTTLAGLAKRLPDGEQFGWLPIQVLDNTRGIVPGNNDPLQATGPTAVRSTLRIEEGLEADDIEFEGLHYARAAQEGYEIFRRLRSEGLIGEGVRYQIGIPTPFTTCLFFDWDVIRRLWPVYERRLLENVAQLTDAIPHEDLAISWDVVTEFMLLTAPESREEYTLEELTRAVARLIDAIPVDVEVGLHFCYGRHNSRGEVEFASPEERQRLTPTLRDISDTELMAQFFSGIQTAASRPINWLHVPVPRSHDDVEFFAPLASLRLGSETELYLGLLHLEDGIGGTKRKIAAAEAAGVQFGIAAPCGFRASTGGLPASIRGLPAERSISMIEYHRQVAQL